MTFWSDITLSDGTTTLGLRIHRVGAVRQWQTTTRPTQPGDPQTPFELVLPFGYSGMGASIELDDMYDYGTANPSLLGRLYPGPKQNDIALTLDGNVKAIFKTTDPAGTEMIFAGGGTKIAKVRRDNDVVKYTATGLSGTVSGQAAIWNNKWYVPMGASPFVQLTTVGTDTAADTWTAGPKAANALAVGFTGDKKGLVRGTTDGVMSICNAVANPNPMTAAHWGTDYPIGTAGQPINAVIPLGRWVFYGKPEGLIASDEQGEDPNLLPSFQAQVRSTNGQGATTFFEWILYPHAAGLIRSTGESSIGIGLEKMPTFSGPIRGRWTALCAVGDFLYGAIYDGTNSWMLQGRRRSDAERGFGPFVFYSLAFITNAQVNCMFFDGGSDTSNGRLYFGRGSNLSYYILSRTGDLLDPGDSALRYATSATHYFSRSNGGRPATLKTFRSIECWGKGLDANTKWQFYASIDGSSFTAVDTPVTANGFQRKFWTPGVNDTGRQIQIAAVYTGASDSAPGYLDEGHIIVRGMERPAQAIIHRGQLELQDSQPGTPTKTARQLYSQMVQWAESGTVLTLSRREPNGTRYTDERVLITAIAEQESASSEGGTAAHVASVELFTLEYS
jgi:hypothetical protein